MNNRQTWKIGFSCYRDKMVVFINMRMRKSSDGIWFLRYGELVYFVCILTLFAKKKCPYNLRSLIHKNICLQLQTSFFLFFFSHIRGQQCDTWVWGLRMEWLVIVFCDLRQRNFNENQVFSHAGKSANAGMWQANGPKGNVLGLCQPLWRYVL